jgi:hypothetical protein
VPTALPRLLLPRDGRCVFRLEKIWGEELPATSPVVPWLIRHSAWLCNRFQPRGGAAQGQTAFEALQGLRYTAPVLAWSVPVAARIPTALQLGKLADRWVPGAFLGKSALADDRLIGTEIGIMRTRGVKTLPVSEMPADFLRRMKWTPWNPKALEPEGVADQLPAESPSALPADTSAARPLPADAQAISA